MHFNKHYFLDFWYVYRFPYVNLKISMKSVNLKLRTTDLQSDNELSKDFSTRRQTFRQSDVNNNQPIILI